MQMKWYQKPVEDFSLAEVTEILEDAKNKTAFPKQYAALLAHTKQQVSELKDKSRRDHPLSWFQPSYEQTLKLNQWIYGFDYLLDFDANRIGKTAGSIVNAQMWIFPNDPEWKMFKTHTDHKNRTYSTIPRPPIEALKEIHETLQKKGLTGNPKLPLDDPQNQQCYNAIKHILKRPPSEYPTPPRQRTVWHGSPDNDYNAEIIMPEWIKWLPPSSIIKESKYDKLIVLESPNPHPKNNRVYPVITTTVLFKSYDSKDSKWSGAAVDGILLSEGVPIDVFNEVRQRYKYPAFASWDYTPYEPRNTASKSALAHKVFKGEELLPLHPFIFSGIGIQDAPDYILPDDKREDLIKMWANNPQGEARIKGNFYSSSPILLKNYEPALHCLSLSFVELQALYAPKPLILFRGLDPGWGHVTACTWMALAPDNSRFVYQMYARSHRSIEERCEDIIILSNNERIRHPKNPNLWYEKASKPENKIRCTWIDYHTFKTDENTKVPFALNYIKAGLSVTKSITFGPKERATQLDTLLQPQLHLPHPINQKPPGSRIYFLVNEPGVAAGMNRISNLFWQTFEKGEKRGLTKDAPQDYDDDELDSLTYVSLPPLNYNSFNLTHDNSRDNGESGENRPVSFRDYAISTAEFSKYSIIR